MIRDRNIEWKTKRLFLPVPGIGETATGLVGRHTGAPVTAEISTLGYGAVQFDTAGDEFVHVLPLPRDVDVDQPIYFRIYWTTDSTTAADTATFILTYADIAAGEALTAADTALSTAIAVDTYGSASADVLAITEWGKLNGKTLTAGDLLILETEIDATDATIGSEYIYYFGLEMEYTPAETKGVGSVQEGYRS